jgi:hypothetical protein
MFFRAYHRIVDEGYNRTPEGVPILIAVSLPGVRKKRVPLAKLPAPLRGAIPAPGSAVQTLKHVLQCELHDPRIRGRYGFAECLTVQVRARIHRIYMVRRVECFSAELY